MNVPTYVQRSRKAGAKQPESTRYCGRGTKYGNDHPVIKDGDTWMVEDEYPEWYGTRVDANQEAVERYQMDMGYILQGNPAYYDDLLSFKHLSCFCDPSLPCHVKDVIIPHLERRLLELENA